MAKKIVKRKDKKEPARTFENQKLQPIDAKTPEELLLRGWAYRVKHDPAKGEADFRKLLEAQPTSVYGQYGLAQVLMEQGRNDEATKVFNEAVKLIDSGAFKEDEVRGGMLRRQALGHIERMKTGQWDLVNIGNALPK